MQRRTGNYYCSFSVSWFLIVLWSLIFLKYFQAILYVHPVPGFCALLTLHIYIFGSAYSLYCLWLGHIYAMKFLNRYCYIKICDFLRTPCLFIPYTNAWLRLVKYLLSRKNCCALPLPKYPIGWHRKVFNRENLYKQSL